MPAAATMRASSMRPRGAAVLDLTEAHHRELLDRVRRQDEDAFRSLFARYAPAAKSLALRVVRQAHLAEEIVQEAFLAVWRNPEGYDARRGSVRSWLMGTVHHRAVDLVRREESHRRRAQQAIVDARDEEVDHADDVAAREDRPKERELVLGALGDLPPEQRAVIELMYFSGLSQSQVAD